MLIPSHAACALEGDQSGHIPVPVQESEIGVSVVHDLGSESGLGPGVHDFRSENDVRFDAHDLGSGHDFGSESEHEARFYVCDLGTESEARRTQSRE